MIIKILENKKRKLITIAEENEIEDYPFLVKKKEKITSVPFLLRSNSDFSDLKLCKSYFVSTFIFVILVVKHC